MPTPLFRKAFDANRLLNEHPPRFRHPHKSLLFEIAYPEHAASKAMIEVTRWPEAIPPELFFSSTTQVILRPDFYDYAPVGGPSAVEWHVNFADPRLFGAYGSALFAQDEMQVAEHPLLACVREALLAEGLAARTVDETGATPILITNVERRLAVETNPDPAAGRPSGLYGNRFATAPIDVVRRATRRLEPSTFSNIIAIAAPSGGDGQYTSFEIKHIFGTAYTAFVAAIDEATRLRGSSAQTVVHSGFWGCGAFGGNRHLMIALQLLAAHAAQIHQLVLHVADAAGVKDAQAGVDAAARVHSQLGTSSTLDVIVQRFLQAGFCWGVSDGN